jgi:hypothetical protein
MSLAYFFAVHKNIPQFERLLKATYHQDNIYLVHLDLKAGFTDHVQFGNLVRKYSNVYQLESQVVNWGYWSLVDVLLNAIEKLMELGEWTHFINLSGQDFPLRPQKSIMEFLSRHKQNNFMTLKTEFEFPAIRLRQKKYFEEIGFDVLMSESDRHPFEYFFKQSIKLYGGSNWVIFNRSLCEYMFQDQLFVEMISYFRHTHVPDESFFQTYIMQSAFSETVIRDNKRFIVMHPDNDFVHPYIWTKNDFDRITNNQAFFSRKFDIEVDAEILDLLEQIIN